MNKFLIFFVFFFSCNNIDFERDYLTSFYKINGNNFEGKKIELLKNKDGVVELKLIDNDFISCYKGSISYFKEKLTFIPIDETISFSICKNRWRNQSMLGYLITDTTNFKNLKGKEIVYNYNEKDTSIMLFKRQNFFEIISNDNNISASLINPSYSFQPDTLRYNINDATICLNSKNYFDTLTIEMKNDSIWIEGNRNLKLTGYLSLNTPVGASW